MSTSRKATIAASGAVAVLLGGLWFGSGVASAGGAPEPGTPDCAALVEADVSVKAAVDAQVKAAAALNKLPATDPGFTAAQTLVVAAGAKLDDVRAKAEVRLCTGAEPADEQPSTEPTTEPTTTVPPTTIVVVPPQRPSHTRADGSRADTDGSQVRVVPEGSVDTGDGSTEVD